MLAHHLAKAFSRFALPEPQKRLQSPIRNYGPLSLIEAEQPDTLRERSTQNLGRIPLLLALFLSFQLFHKVLIHRMVPENHPLPPLS